MRKPRHQSSALVSVVLATLGLWFLPPDLQGQQPVVVGDSVLASWKEAGIDPDVIFVPVVTH